MRLPDRSRELLLAVMPVLLVVLVVVLAIYQLRPPRPVSKSAPPEAFSSGRAMEHLQVIAAEPHPMGSPEHAKVRSYILETIADLGFHPQVHKAQVRRSRGPAVIFATVHNLLVRIPGKQSSKALLLMSHYDSVPNAPGATDDGAGVAAMLETMRALKHHKTLKNDVIFLFTDGEERGLLGAKAFVEQHPWANEVGLVLNFEGSGSSGQVIMFETSEGNGRLIREFAKAAPYPIANSLSYEIYRKMPNDTDMTMFKRHGIAGLNFAYIDDRHDYHTMNDNVENLDEGSLQHHGSYALALTLHFGGMDLSDLDAQNSVYFNPFGWGFVHYPQGWVLPLMLLAVAGVMGFMTLGFRNGSLHVPGVVKGFLAFLLLMTAAPAVVTCLYRFISEFYPDADWWLLYYNDKKLLLGFVFLSICLSTLLYLWLKSGVDLKSGAAVAAAMFILLGIGDLLSITTGLMTVGVFALLLFFFRQPLDGWHLSAGGLLGWMGLTILISVLIPGGSYILLWPLLLTLVPMYVFLLRAEYQMDSVQGLALALLFSLPGVLWFSQLIYIFFQAMGLPMSGLAVALVSIPMGLMLPFWESATRLNRWWLAATSAVCSFFFLVSGTVAANYTPRYAKPTSLFLSYDADTGVSRWATTDRNLDEWTAEFLSGPAQADLGDLIPTVSSVPISMAPGPQVSVNPPELMILEDSGVDELHRLRLRIASPRQASDMNIFLKSASAIRSVAVNGMHVVSLEELENEWRQWRYYAIPAEGIELELELAAGGELDIRLLDISYGYSGISSSEIPVRPPDRMTRPYTLSDMILVSKSFKVPGDVASSSK